MCIRDRENHCAEVINLSFRLITNPKAGEVSIALIDDVEMTELNSAYRGINAPTNVLSFPDHGPALVLGDIVISYDKVTAEAVRDGKSQKDHLTHLLIHGFLHLQGYEHEIDSDAEQMEALEIKILTQLDIDNPYQIIEP